MPPIAYVILAHRVPRQVARLVQALASDVSQCYVHIDKGAPSAVHREVHELLGPRLDVQLLSSRRTPWGGFGLVLATLDGIRAARADDAQTVVVLSGQDYPVRPTEQIVTFLQEHAGSSFMELRRLPRDDWPPPGGLERYEGRGIRLLGRDLVVKSGPRTRWLPRKPVRIAPLEPYHGSQFFSLSARASDWVLTHLADDAARLRAFRAVKVPDETAVHSVLVGSPLRDTLVNQSIVYADWTADGDHPEPIGRHHLPLLAGSPHLFARKFDLLADPELLDQVDVELRRTDPLSG